MKYHKTSDHIALIDYFNDLKKNNLSFSSIFNSNDSKIQIMKQVQSKSIRYLKIYNIIKLKLIINYL